MSYDAVIVGAGPNGLTAAARLATQGRKVLVLEQASTIGGGSRTAELIEAGVRHDVCAAVHPFGIASPAFRVLDLEAHGVRWLVPEHQLVHLFEDGDAAVLDHDIDRTAATLGTEHPADADAYRHLIGPLAEHWPDLVESVLGPPLRPPRHPLLMARFGVAAALPASLLAKRFKGRQARALLAGLSAHSARPLSSPFTGGVGLALLLAGHGAGWPVAEGGSQAIVDALASVVRLHGGEIVTNQMVHTLAELPAAPITICDVTPRQLVAMAGDRLIGPRARRYRRWRYGPGAAKVDYVLSGPRPWRNEAARRTATLHLGDTFEDIASSERECGRQLPERPFVLVAQPSVVDPTRAPNGRHVLWAYCHVPSGSQTDPTRRIEAQIDRFAPGWRDLIQGRVVRTAAGYAEYNPNNIDGDIAGGTLTPGQLIGRPRFSPDPYRTPLDGVWLCSASTPPGAGVHGMGGWWAAASAQRATR